MHDETFKLVHHATTTAETFASLQSRHTDVDLYCDDHAVRRCHQFILENHSPFLARLFGPIRLCPCRNLLTCQADKTVSISLPGVEARHVDKLLALLYAGNFVAVGPAEEYRELNNLCASLGIFFPHSSMGLYAVVDSPPPPPMDEDRPGDRPTFEEAADDEDKKEDDDDEEEDDDQKSPMSSRFKVSSSVARISSSSNILKENPSAAFPPRFSCWICKTKFCHRVNLVTHLDEHDEHERTMLIDFSDVEEGTGWETSEDEKEEEAKPVQASLVVKKKERKKRSVKTVKKVRGRPPKNRKEEESKKTSMPADKVKKRGRLPAKRDSQTSKVAEKVKARDRPPMVRKATASAASSSTGGGQRVCYLCQKSLSTTAGLRLHVVGHFSEQLVAKFGGIEGVKCPLCDFQGKFLSNVIYHVGILHGEVEAFMEKSLYEQIFKCGRRVSTLVKWNEKLRKSDC